MINVKSIFLGFMSACSIASISSVSAQETGTLGQSNKTFDCSDVPLFSISAFEPMDATLPISSQYVLDLVAKRLASKTCIITITGYGSVDFDGTKRESASIALERAQNVVDALVKRGIPAGHLLPETGGAVTTFGTASSNRRVTVAFTPERGFRCTLLSDDPAPELRVTVSSFAAGSSTLETGAVLDINTFVTFENRPECNLVVQAYTSIEGSDMENDLLAASRAESIQQAMKQLGVSSDRVSLMPMGPTEAFGEDLSSNRRAILRYR